jgi:hypothetical protein
MRGALAFVFAAICGEALACGYCVEDKVAAVYDHAVIVGALDHRHSVVFLAIEGPLQNDDGRVIESSLRGIRGVDRGSLRVSVPGAALSFAYDPKRDKLGPILSGLERRLQPKGLGVSILKVLDGAQ